MTDPLPPKLSKTQKHILKTLLQWTEQREAQLTKLPEKDFARIEFQNWGVAWHTTGSRSQQAVLSRALARLEARGLLLRQCSMSTSGRKSIADPAPPKTTSVTLTDEGRDLAKRLT